uniref:Alternative protein TGM7 n=1 Tax=Homo sapiens TaxID=9606 RepID=L0R6R2_HUMAN|nr:alternative protein TGM7 [Homo sapiens]
MKSFGSLGMARPRKSWPTTPVPSGRRSALRWWGQTSARASPAPTSTQKDPLRRELSS